MELYSNEQYPGQQKQMGGPKTLLAHVTLIQVNALHLLQFFLLSVVHVGGQHEERTKN